MRNRIKGLQNITWLATDARLNTASSLNHLAFEESTRP